MESSLSACSAARPGFSMRLRSSSKSTTLYRKPTVSALTVLGSAATLVAERETADMRATCLASAGVASGQHLSTSSAAAAESMAGDDERDAHSFSRPFLALPGSTAQRRSTSAP
jgi:hypothetical protein